jgi:hypothetical protein
LSPSTRSATSSTTWRHPSSSIQLWYLTYVHRSGQKNKNNAASVDRTQYLQNSHVMRDSSELQSGALPGELKRLDGSGNKVYAIIRNGFTLLLAVQRSTGTSLLSRNVDYNVTPSPTPPTKASTDTACVIKHHHTDILKCSTRNDHQTKSEPPQDQREAA